jgi:hypothetical protein
MPFKINPIYGTLDLVNASGGSGSGDVSGPGSSTDKAIVRWNGTSGELIQDSLTLLQDGGSIEAQGFITRRSITADVVINPGESWIAPSLELELTGSIELEQNAEIIMI